MISCDNFPIFGKISTMGTVFNQNSGGGFSWHSVHPNQASSPGNPGKEERLTVMTEII